MNVNSDISGECYHCTSNHHYSILLINISLTYACKFVGLLRGRSLTSTPYTGLKGSHTCHSYRWGMIPPEFLLSGPGYEL